jgi:hypothetical protein
LNQVMELQLTADDVAALAARTEGWIAGLQLAALSLQGRDAEAKRQFVAAFSGSQVRASGGSSYGVHTTPGATPGSKRGETMADRAPIEITNLDRYGYAELPWSRPRDLLAASATSNTTFFLGTARPDGRSHAAGVGALWLDGDLYFTSGPQTRKARNLAANPACTISVKLEGTDLILEGQATRITDRQTLEAVARLYREGGWPVQVEGDSFTAPYSAPSAGSPPWQL